MECATPTWSLLRYTYKRSAYIGHVGDISEACGKDGWYEGEACAAPYSFIVRVAKQTDIHRSGFV